MQRYVNDPGFCAVGGREKTGYHWISTGIIENLKKKKLQ